MNVNTIIIVGYPRSGNAWLARLLSDVLNSSILPYDGVSYPLAFEGDKRSDFYKIYQQHLFPTSNGNYFKFMATQRLAYLPKWNGEQIICMRRDPRDIAISVQHFWKLDSINTAIQRMKKPLGEVNRWDEFMEAWLNIDQIPVWHICYEDLFVNTFSTLIDLLYKIQIDPNNLYRPSREIEDVTFNHDLIHQAIERQTFSKKVVRYAERSDTDPQKRHLRQGIAGDWINHFTKEDLVFIEDAFGSTMRKLNYV